MHSFGLVLTRYDNENHQTPNIYKVLMTTFPNAETRGRFEFHYFLSQVKCFGFADKVNSYLT